MYNTENMQTALEGLEYPEFRLTSANPYYRIPTGLQSPYGDQLITMLESLVASDGKCLVSMHIGESVDSLCRDETDAPMA